MSDAILISIIASIASIISAVIGGYVAIKIAGIHKQLNSMRDQENKTNRDLGHAEGKAEEKAKKK